MNNIHLQEFLYEFNFTDTYTLIFDDGTVAKDCKFSKATSHLHTPYILVDNGEEVDCENFLDLYYFNSEVVEVIKQH